MHRSTSGTLCFLSCVCHGGVPYLIPPQSRGAPSSLQQQPGQQDPGLSPTCFPTPPDSSDTWRLQTCTGLAWTKHHTPSPSADTPQGMWHTTCLSLTSKRWFLLGALHPVVGHWVREPVPLSSTPRLTTYLHWASSQQGVRPHRTGWQLQSSPPAWLNHCNPQPLLSPHRHQAQVPCAQCSHYLSHSVVCLMVVESSLLSLAKGTCAESYPEGPTQTTQGWPGLHRCLDSRRGQGSVQETRNRALSKATFHRTPGTGQCFGLEYPEIDFGPRACRTNQPKRVPQRSHLLGRAL